MLTTFAKIIINNCPMISIFIDEIDSSRFQVSVCLTETSSVNYLTDPAESYRRRLSGIYAKDPSSHNYLQLPGLPEEIMVAARVSIANGGYNYGPCRDYFSTKALNYFAPLPAWYNGGREEYLRLIDEAIAKLQALRACSNVDKLDSICLALGLPRG